MSNKKNKIENCKMCGKNIARNKSGYCRNCGPKTKQLRQKNSLGTKKAHITSYEKYLHPGAVYGAASKQYIEKYPQCRKKSGRTLSQKIKNGEIIPSFKNKHHSDFMRNHLSLARLNVIQNKQYKGVKWFQVNGIKVQGTWQKKFAQYLTNKNISWERKRLIFQRVRRYTPDFYCKEYDCYFEVKGYVSDRDLYKMYLALDDNPDVKIKMITRNELKDLENINIFQLKNFNEIHKRQNIDMSKFKNIWLIE